MVSKVCAGHDYGDVSLPQLLDKFPGINFVVYGVVDVNNGCVDHCVQSRNGGEYGTAPGQNALSIHASPLL